MYCGAQAQHSGGGFSWASKLALGVGALFLGGCGQTNDPGVAAVIVDRPANVVADGTDSAQIHVSLAAAGIDGPADRTVTIEVSGTGNTVTQPSPKSDAEGIVIATVSSTKAETKTVTVTVDPGANEIVLPYKPTISFIGDSNNVSATKTTVSCSPTSAVVSSPVTVTVAVRDVNDNPVPQQPVYLTATGTGNTITQPTQTDQAGLTSGTLVSTAAGVKTISVTVGNGANKVSVPNAGDVEFKTDMAQSISQWGITWHFDKVRRVGQFVNGDWWVVGPLTVVKVDPAPVNNVNGSMVNPVTGPQQGYSGRVGYFSSAVSAKFPLQLQPNQSLVSTIDLPNGGKDLRGIAIPAAHTKIKTAAVLTVLAAPAAPYNFRPPFIGDKKPLYSANSLRTDRLPTLKPVAKTPSFGYYERGLERVWLQHIPDWQCRMMHPLENMLNYYREINYFYSEACLLLMLDYPQTKKRTLLIRMVQQGIDQYYTAINGPGSRSLSKFAILFAGTMLDAPEIYNVFKENRVKHNFSQDKQTYYAKDGTSTLKSAVVAPGKGWTGATVLWRLKAGQHEHEHLHPSEWAKVPSDGGGGKNESYRHCCTSWTWVGQCLAARHLSMQANWNHPAFFDYMDRWMTEDFSPFIPVIKLYYPSFWSMARSGGGDFVNQMWKAYR